MSKALNVDAGSCSQLRADVGKSKHFAWRGGRVVEGARLLSVCGGLNLRRGFESLPLRHSLLVSPDSKQLVTRRPNLRSIDPTGLNIARIGQDATNLDLTTGGQIAAREWG